MEAYTGEWLQLLLRWVHLITGIAWIGASFYFVFLDNSLLPPSKKEDADDGVGGELWAIHGGGFYHVRKFRVAPAALPEPLHWFKWEAYWTWMTGFALFAVMYYAHADVYMIDRGVADLAPWQAVAISVALLVAGWVFYDQLCKRAGLDREKLLATAMVAFFVSVAWGLSHVYSGRAMFLQIGAMMGTIMAWNVFFMIMPAQRKLVEAKQLGIKPDPVHGLRGKQRSVHNNYFTLPVLFVMVSNHYPITFGHARAWLVLVAVLLLAAFVRHFFNLRHKGRTVWSIPVAAAVGTVALAVAIAPPKPGPAKNSTFADVQRVIATRCAGCHAESPTQPGFTVAPKGLVLETAAQIVANAARINEQAVVARTMPIGNLTQMTDEERGVLAAWIAAGASNP
ncbi:MAG TPA: urate hydroxylase PuuD [Casimicrobiaceae bacterium]|nr:urate hydroxylase PuuD [Casimicrobiaceae bacterium]